MDQTKLLSKHLFFDLLTEDLANDITRILNNPNMFYSNLLSDEVNDIPILSTKKVEKVLSDFEQNKELIAFSIFKRESKQFIGYIIYQFGWDVYDCGLNIVIDPDHQRNGYGTEVANFIVPYIFNNTVANSISCYVDDQNPMANNFALKMSFKFNGKERRSGFRNGKYYGTSNYNLVRKEWRESYGN